MGEDNAIGTMDGQGHLRARRCVCKKNVRPGGDRLGKAHVKQQAAQLREYVERGGFLMVDDFHAAQEWAVFMDSLQRVFPNALVVAFVANLFLFWLLLIFDVEKVIVARVFFVWVSVFNLFAVAVFWSFMADLFTSEQGKRLFGFIGAGGTAGAVLGPVVTIWLSAPLGPVNLLIVAAALLELAVLCVYRIERVANPPTEVDSRRRRVGGSAFAGLSELIRSPYLLGVAGWVSLLSFGATITYFAQANIVSATIQDAATQTRLFAGIDLAVSLLSLATQVFATATFLKRFGTGIAAAALPAIYIVGFVALAIAPSLSVVVTLQVAQRWMNFAIANPARQVFFTVVGREEKYKAKNLIDVVIYRGSDALYGWVYDSLQAVGLKLGAIALCALPIAAGWLALSTALGRTQERLARRTPDEGASAWQSE